MIGRYYFVEQTFDTDNNETTQEMPPPWEVIFALCLTTQVRGTSTSFHLSLATGFVDDFGVLRVQQCFVHVVGFFQLPRLGVIQGLQERTPKGTWVAVRVLALLWFLFLHLWLALKPLGVSLLLAIVCSRSAGAASIGVAEETVALEVS